MRSTVVPAAHAIRRGGCTRRGNVPIKLPSYYRVQGPEMTSMPHALQLAVGVRSCVHLPAGCPSCLRERSAVACRGRELYCMWRQSMG